MAQYLYLSRLQDEEVLVSAIRNGVSMLTWTDYFAYASAIGEDGKYIGLVTGSIPAVALDGRSVLVKPEAAQKQREEETTTIEKPAYVTGGGEPTTPIGGGEIPGITPPQPQVRILRRFHGNVELDPARVGTSAGRIAEEVISHLAGLVGAKVNVMLEIDVGVPDGISEDKIRIVSENCNTLKFSSHEFEEE